MEFEIDGRIDLLDSRASNGHEEWTKWLRFGPEWLWPKWGEERKKKKKWGGKHSASRKNLKL